MSSRLYSGVSFNPFLVFLLDCGNEGAGFCFFLCKNPDRFLDVVAGMLSVALRRLFEKFVATE